MSTSEVGHSYDFVGQLLRGVDQRPRGHDDSAIGDDRSPSDLACLDRAVLNPAIVTPFAGVIHASLACLEAAGVTAKGVRCVGHGHRSVGGHGRLLATLDELDVQSLGRRTDPRGTQPTQAVPERGLLSPKATSWPWFRLHLSIGSTCRIQAQVNTGPLTPSRYA